VKTVIGQGTTTYNYQYDLENRLTKVLSGNTEITSYAYFSDGSRIRRTASGVATYFLYDFRDFSGYNDVIAEYDASGNMVARYIHGPGIDEPLAMSRGGSWYYYHVDGLGSVTMLTRSDKTVANRYVYDDFGGFRSKTEVVTNTYGFTGREYDSAVDLIYYRARYYDPLIGRFLTRDPAGMGDGANLYVYAGNNPQSFVDPTGKQIYISPIFRTCIFQVLSEAGNNLKGCQGIWKNDKFTHCWAAGMLVRRCGLTSDLAFGVLLLKEPGDFLRGDPGPGDIVANWIGAYVCAPRGHWEWGWWYLRWVPDPIDTCCESYWGSRYTYRCGG